MIKERSTLIDEYWKCVKHKITETRWKINEMVLGLLLRSLKREKVKALASTYLVLEALDL